MKIKYDYVSTEWPMNLTDLDNFARSGFELVSIVYVKETDRYVHYFKKYVKEDEI